MSEKRGTEVASSRLRAPSRDQTNLVDERRVIGVQKARKFQLFSLFTSHHFSSAYDFEDLKQKYCYLNSFVYFCGYLGFSIISFEYVRQSVGFTVLIADFSAHIRLHHISSHTQIQILLA